MYSEELQAIHDEIWTQIFERQKCTLASNTTWEHRDLIFENKIFTINQQIEAEITSDCEEETL